MSRLFLPPWVAEDTRPEHLSFERWLPGGSSCCLVRDDRGEGWVVKLLSTHQRVPILFNEAFATELMLAAGLPCPSWRTIRLRKDALLKDERFAEGLPLCLPFAGPYFASRYIPSVPGVRMVVDMQFITPTLQQVRALLLGAYVFDIWVAHRDRRQTLSAISHSGDRQWFFIDNSHVFAQGSHGREPWCRKTSVHDPPFHILAASKTGKQVIENWIKRIKTACPEVLRSIEERMPPQWIPSNLSMLNDILLSRLEKLTSLVEQDQNSLQKGHRSPHKEIIWSSYLSAQQESMAEAFQHCC